MHEVTSRWDVSWGKPFWPRGAHPMRSWSLSFKQRVEERRQRARGWINSRDWLAEAALRPREAGGDQRLYEREHMFRPDDGLRG